MSLALDPDPGSRIRISPRQRHRNRTGRGLSVMGMRTLEGFREALVDITYQRGIHGQ